MVKERFIERTLSRMFKSLTTWTSTRSWKWKTDCRWNRFMYCSYTEKRNDQGYEEIKKWQSWWNWWDGRDIKYRHRQSSTLFGKKYSEVIWIKTICHLYLKQSFWWKIQKKGDISNCNNYKGITLLFVPSEVFQNSKGSGEAASQRTNCVVASNDKISTIDMKMHSWSESWLI